MKSDSELLQKFSGHGNQDAFAELVSRHVDLVYSAALRQVNGDAHLAQDVAQRVFVALAQKAKELGSRESLVGWLYTSAHHAAANAVRGERRRRTHEQEALAMQQIDAEENNRADWERLRPVLDQAMLELDEVDRDAVLRRFFSGESFAAIGDALELSHDAARKRVERALDRLHGLLARRGIASSASALGLALSHHAVSAAPVGFGALVTQAAFSGGGIAAATGLFLMNKIAVGLTAATLIALLALQYRERSELTAELRQRRQEQAALRSRADQIQHEMALARADHATRATEALSNQATATPEQLRPITGTERANLDSTYALLFRGLRLETEKLAGLKDLLALRERTDKEVQLVVKAAGLKDDQLTWKEWAALRAVAARDVDQKIRTFLGDHKSEYFQNYVRTSLHRSQFNRLDQLLSRYGEPLSVEQIDQMTAWSVAESRESAFPPTIPKGVVAKSEALLTAFQWEKLKLIQAESVARIELIEINQAAAEKGLLRLNTQSAREYAERAKSTKPGSLPSP